MTGKSVLDFGCGTGRAALIFSSQSYVGVDVDLDRLNVAARLHRDHSFLLTKSGRLPFQDQSFDVVFVCSVLHHLSDEEVLFYASEFRRVLRLNGIAIFVEPIYRPDAPVTNRFMAACDQGQFIRPTAQYERLLAGALRVCVHMRYRAPNLYNYVVVSGTNVNAWSDERSAVIDV